MPSAARGLLLPGEPFGLERSNQVASGFQRGGLRLHAMVWGGPATLINCGPHCVEQYTKRTLLLCGILRSI